MKDIIKTAITYLCEDSCCVKRTSLPIDIASEITKLKPGYFYKYVVTDRFKIDNVYLYRNNGKEITRCKRRLCNDPLVVIEKLNAKINLHE